MDLTYFESRLKASIAMHAVYLKAIPQLCFDDGQYPERNGSKVAIERSRRIDQRRLTCAMRRLEGVAPSVTSLASVIVLLLSDKRNATCSAFPPDGNFGWKADTRTPWSAVIPRGRVFARTAIVSNGFG